MRATFNVASTGNTSIFLEDHMMTTLAQGKDCLYPKNPELLETVECLFFSQHTCTKQLFIFDSPV